MHHTTRQEFYNWVHNIFNDYSAIFAFCDWLDENNIRSQKWKEIKNLLHKVIVYRVIDQKYYQNLTLQTPSRIINISLFKKTKRLSVRISQSSYDPENYKKDGNSLKRKSVPKNKEQHSI